MLPNCADVAIVGSGPAGSALALLLARKGYDVVLLERAAFPRPKPCGEYLTPGAVRLLRDECGVLPQLLDGGAVFLSHETVRTHGGVTFGGPTTALACPRSVLDLALQNAARAAGVRVVEGFRARAVCWNGSTVVGVSGTDALGQAVDFRARVTVGADGTRSLVARALGVVRPLPRLQRLALVGHWREQRQAPPAPQVWGEETTRSGAHFTVLTRAEATQDKLPCTFSPQTWGAGGAIVSMHLPADKTDACCGVGAACGINGARNVNLVVPQTEAKNIAGRHVEYFQDTLRVSFPGVWDWVKDAQAVAPLQSVGCFGHTTTRAAHSGALLVGDAATFIHPFTGEGVFFALEGARLASQAVDAALRAGDTSYAVLRAYDAARKKELLPRYKLCGWVQRVTHSPAWLSWAAERLRRSPDLTHLLLQTIGDAARPQDLFSLRTLKLF